jgi:hypothetical protein
MARPGGVPAPAEARAPHDGAGHYAKALNSFRLPLALALHFS